MNHSLEKPSVSTLRLSQLVLNSDYVDENQNFQHSFKKLSFVPKVSCLA